MTNEEHKKELQLLKDNLVDNYVIYHERVTLLVELTRFDIMDTSVAFKAKIIKPLDKEFAEANKLYQYIITKDEITFSETYLLGNDDTSKLIKNKKFGRPYCPFILWLDSELAKFVLENDDEITKQIPELLFSGEDWTILKQTK